MKSKEGGDEKFHCYIKFENNGEPKQQEETKKLKKHSERGERGGSPNTHRLHPPLLAEKSGKSVNQVKTLKNFHPMAKLDGFQGPGGSSNINSLSIKGLGAIQH